MIPTIIAQPARDGLIRLGSLKPTRDFLFVKDTVAAFTAVEPHRPSTCWGEVFNVGTGRETSIDELANAVAKIMGRRLTVPAVEWQCADVARSREMLGWAPSRTLCASARDLWHHAIGASRAPLW